MNMLVSRLAILSSVLRFQSGVVLRVEEGEKRREQLEQLAACTLCAREVFTNAASSLRRKPSLSG